MGGESVGPKKNTHCWLAPSQIPSPLGVEVPSALRTAATRNIFGGNIMGRKATTTSFRHQSKIPHILAASKGFARSTTRSPNWGWDWVPGYTTRGPGPAAVIGLMGAVPGAGDHLPGHRTPVE